MNVKPKIEEETKVKPINRALEGIKQSSIIKILNEKYRNLDFWDSLGIWKYALVIGFMAVLFKIWAPHSVNMWDEGWFINITSNMADGGNWIYPIYDDVLSPKIFDKPPLMFWFGAICMLLIGIPVTFLRSLLLIPEGIPPAATGAIHTTLAVKIPIALPAGLMAVAAVFIWRRNRIAGVVAGLMTGSTFFVNFYARTAYLDAAIVAMSGFVAVFGVLAIDNCLEGRKRGWILLLLTSLATSVLLMAKAWQGLVVGGGIAVYLIVRYYQHSISHKHDTQYFNRLSTYSRYVWSSLGNLTLNCKS